MTKESQTHLSVPEKKHLWRKSASFVGSFALAVTGYLATEQLISAEGNNPHPPTCETSPIDLTIDGQSVLTVGERTRHDMRSRRNQILIGAAGLLEEAGFIDIDCDPPTAKPISPELPDDISELAK